MCTARAGWRCVANIVASGPPPQPVIDQTERILQTTGQAVAEMEKNAERAPEGTKTALEKLLQTTKKDWEKHHGKKGPPWLRDPFQKGDPKGPKTKSQKKSFFDSTPGTTGGDGLAWRRAEPSLTRLTRPATIG